MWRYGCILVCLIVVLNGCGTPPETREFKEKPAVSSVAIWDLDNLSPDPSMHADWGELMSAGVLQAFESSGKYTVVEREKLLLALEELQLGTSALADESTRLKLGRVVGAKWMVFGTYMVIDDTLRIDLRRVEVETGGISKTAQQIVTPADPGAAMAGAGEAAGKLL